jgi:hypothetical protein
MIRPATLPRLCAAAAFSALAFHLAAPAGGAAIPTAISAEFAAANVAATAAATLAPLRPASLQDGSLPPSPPVRRKPAGSLKSAHASVRPSLRAITGIPVIPALDTEQRRLAAAGLSSAPPAPGKYSPLWFWKQDIDELAAIAGEDAVHAERVRWLKAASAASR